MRTQGWGGGVFRWRGESGVFESLAIPVTQLAWRLSCTWALRAVVSVALASTVTPVGNLGQWAISPTLGGMEKAPSRACATAKLGLAPDGKAWLIAPRTSFPSARKAKFSLMRTAGLRWTLVASSRSGSGQSPMRYDFSCRTRRV